MNNNNDDKTFYCPVCEDELIFWKNLPLETLDEHVSNVNHISQKPALICSNKNCPSHAAGLMWDDVFGDIFYYSYNGYNKSKSIQFISDNKYPFGSPSRKAEFARKLEEKYNRYIFTFPKWSPGILSEMQIKTNWHFTTDDDGKIIKKSLKLYWIRKDNIIHNWGLNMLLFCIKQDFKAWKDLRKNPEKTYCINHLKDSVKQLSWKNPEWWRIVCGYFSKFLLKNLKINS